MTAGSNSAVVAGIVLMWPPLPPPRPGMSEETRQSKLAAAKKKVKHAGSRLPDSARDPFDGRAMARVCAASKAHGASPSAPLGAPLKKSSQPVPPPGSPAPDLTRHPRVTLGW